MPVIRLATIALTSVVAFATLAGCSPSPVVPSPSASESIAPSESTPSTPEPSPEPEALSEGDLENLAAAVNTGNTAAIESYLAEPTIVIYAATECCGELTRTEAIEALDYLSGAMGPWTFPTPEATIDTYRAGFYTDYFPAGAYVGQSSDADPWVVSFTVDGDTITTIFLTAAASLLL